MGALDLMDLFRAIRRWYSGFDLPDDPNVILDKLVEVPGSFEIEVPEGPAAELSLTYNVRPYLIRVGPVDSDNPHYIGECGVTVLVDVIRARPVEKAFVERREFIIGKFARPFGEAPTLAMSGSGPGTDADLVGTKRLLVLPSGGPAVVRGRITSETSVSYAMLTVRKV